MTDVLEPEPVEEFDPNFDMVLKYFKNQVSFTQRIKSVTDSAYTLNGEVMFMTCDPKQCLPPEYVEFAFDIPVATGDIKASNDASAASTKGMWGIFLIAFLSGFAALLTPCVFPMIPMTVSYFTSRVRIKQRSHQCYYLWYFYHFDLCGIRSWSVCCIWCGCFKQYGNQCIF